MATNNSSNNKFTNSTDGFILGGGTTERDLTVTGANITITGSGTNTYTFPASTSTIASQTLAEIFLNKTIDTAGPNTIRVNGATLATFTGSGQTVVFATSPTLITPTLGVATATSLQANTLTATTNNSINLRSGSYNTIQSYTPAAGATATIDLSLGNIHHILHPSTGTITLATSNGTTGQVFMARITQSAVGSGTVAWFTTIKWAGGVAPTLTTTGTKADSFGFEITALNAYDGFVIGQNI